MSEKTLQQVKNDMKSKMDISEQYTRLNKIPVRDLKSNLSRYIHDMDLGYGGRYGRRFSKKQIANFLADPMLFENELREAVIYIYNASPHFRRLIQYFVGLTDLSFVVLSYTPSVEDESKYNFT